MIVRAMQCQPFQLAVSPPASCSSLNLIAQETLPRTKGSRSRGDTHVGKVDCHPGLVGDAHFRRFCLDDHAVNISHFRSDIFDERRFRSGICPVCDRRRSGKYCCESRKDSQSGFGAVELGIAVARYSGYPFDNSLRRCAASAALAAFRTSRAADAPPAIASGAGAGFAASAA
jgi:hypothetical protein